jgi:hypothetical protein
MNSSYSVKLRFDIELVERAMWNAPIGDKVVRDFTPADSQLRQSHSTMNHIIQYVFTHLRWHSTYNPSTAYLTFSLVRDAEDYTNWEFDKLCDVVVSEDVQGKKVTLYEMIYCNATVSKRQVVAAAIKVLLINILVQGLN